MKTVITISHLGYIKRTNLNEYRLQGRAGWVPVGANTQARKILQEHIYTANMHSTMLFFSTQRKVLSG